MSIKSKKLDGGGFKMVLNIVTVDSHSFIFTWFGVTKGKWYAELK